jgi:hypothetical protein
MRPRGETAIDLADIAQELELVELTPPSPDDDAVVTRGYASDLLSDVLAHAPAGGVLVTLQVHLNVVAVASHAELAAVIFASGRMPDEEVVAKAESERITLFSSPQDTFEIVGRLYALGLKGSDA